MKTFLLFLGVGLLACHGVSYGQEPASQKSSLPTAEFIIKVQTDQTRSAGFTSQVNAVQGLSVKSVCHSDKKPVWYVLIEMDRQVLPDIHTALEQLSQQLSGFKRMDMPSADFNTLCNN